jgi:hypothetical protein
MNDKRLGGLALILGAISGIVTLTFHPSGAAHPVTPGQFEALVAIIIGVHALALSGLPLSFAGALALTHQLDSRFRIAILGLVVYGFGLVAMMIAATLSGLVIPHLLRQLIADRAASGEWHRLMDYTHSLNQAFAQIGAFGFSIAILLWSVAVISRQNRELILGVYGIVCAIAVCVALMFGVLNMELHGFRVITLAQAMWFILAGIYLWRLRSDVSDGIPAAAPNCN